MESAAVDGSSAIGINASLAMPVDARDLTVGIHMSVTLGIHAPLDDERGARRFSVDCAKTPVTRICDYCCRPAQADLMLFGRGWQFAMLRYSRPRARTKPLLSVRSPCVVWRVPIRLAARSRLEAARVVNWMLVALPILRCARRLVRAHRRHMTDGWRPMVNWRRHMTDRRR